MLNDDRTRTDLNRDNLTGGGRRGGIGGGLIALIAGAALIAVLFMWAPWSGDRTASNTSPGATVGSSTARPAAPAAPSTR